MDTDTYLAERVNDQLNWLEKKSADNKNAFLRYRVIGIVLGALITILSPYARGDGRFQEWIPPALQLAGAGVALSGSLLALQRHQENWLRYRSLKEALEREKMLYLTGSTPPYASPEAFHAFVRNVEDLMASERLTWVRQTGEQANEQENKADRSHPSEPSEASSQT